jgi:hypothetical protein
MLKAIKIRFPSALDAMYDTKMKIIFSFDVEGDLHKYVHSPYIWHKITKTPDGNYYQYSGSKAVALKNYFKWRLNNLRYKTKGSEGLKNILSFLEKEQIPSSLNLCGYFYFKKPVEISTKMPWAIGQLKKDNYFWKSRGNLDFSRILGNINNNALDLGIHGYIHEAFPLESEEIQDSILKETIAAGKSMGFNLKTFVPPFNMSFNNNEKEVLGTMKKNKLSCIRVSGSDNFFESFSHKTQVKRLEEKEGIKRVYLSESIEGTSKPEKVSHIIDKIKKNYAKGRIFCIMAHDYTFKNTDSLALLVNKLRSLQENYQIEFTNLKKI